MRPDLVEKPNARTEGRPARRRWLRLAGVALVLAAVGAAATLGWRWHRSVPVRRVAVEGATRAAPDSIRRLTRVDTGQALYQLQPRHVADRAERHPWVESAAASRSSDGTLRIRVTERTPAALVMQGGEGAYYLDAAGYPLPLSEKNDAAFDVPLVRGLAEDFQPLRPTGREAIRALLGALAESDDARALVSEIRVGREGGIRLRTVRPGGRGPSATVRLGTGAFSQKLRRLVAFWRQAVREKPRTVFRKIDLRFDGQIVARQDSFSPIDSTD
ncbi:MAG: cell division protein FtsQ [Bacteroidetes bacterium QS_8_68_28]|nr:MAG: cell division protein FtsQ [Bacteroidetes bacterium QS_8_68_28]